MRHFWHHGFSYHFRIRRREAIFINRWHEARQIGLGFCCNISTGRVRWIFFTNYRFGLLGW